MYSIISRYLAYRFTVWYLDISPTDLQYNISISHLQIYSIISWYLTYRFTVWYPGCLTYRFTVYLDISPTDLQYNISISHLQIYSISRYLTYRFTVYLIISPIDLQNILISHLQIYSMISPYLTYRFTVAAGGTHIASISLPVGLIIAGRTAGLVPAALQTEVTGAAGQTDRAGWGLTAGAVEAGRALTGGGGQAVALAVVARCAVLTVGHVHFVCRTWEWDNEIFMIKNQRKGLNNLLNHSRLF